MLVPLEKPTRDVSFADKNEADREKAVAQFLFRMESDLAYMLRQIEKDAGEAAKELNKVKDRMDDAVRAAYNQKWEAVKAIIKEVDIPLKVVEMWVTNIREGSPKGGAGKWKNDFIQWIDNNLEKIKNYK